ncbi:ornithine carbamoyltransferase [Aeromicrobium sp.]|uniref:ornithine carbamoyltransferase n=1 Tax=Aeromicrobium sp. TaxID=1871063 RepID=UPI0019C6BCAE|nr:ornithine carbamoyltransferase [Aeromicrobium sp.]MBC7631599.1 ornithine carbamoyltransferase [Aeromicrobium sp.]
MTSLDTSLSDPIPLTHLGLAGHSFTKELDVTVTQWRGLLELAAVLKHERRTGHEKPRLQGRNLALIFAKSSTRTRCAFEVAAHEQGAHVTYLDPSGSQLGHKESVKDTGRVLGRMFDGIEYRGFSQAGVEELASSSGVPVWNGLTDEWHPTQSLCDMLTMLEHTTKPASEISFAYCGDARNNTANSLLVAGAMMGMKVTMVSPPQLANPDSVVAIATKIATTTGARITQTSDVAAGVAGADFIYTDVWLSMGEPESEWDERIALLSDYQVNADLLGLTGNPDVKFMHCLPAFHDRRTEVGEQIFERTGRTCLEVTDDVFESDASIVFDQAENRMHTIKAVLVATLEKR